MPYNAPITPSTKIGYGLSANYIPGTAKDNASTQKDMFLKLLITQMKYQDPSAQKDPSAQIAQMANLSSMEQMSNLNANMVGLMSLTNTAQSVALIGHTVEATQDNGAPISGKVTAVEFVEGVPKIKIGNVLVSLSHVTRVTA